MDWIGSAVGRMLATSLLATWLAGCDDPGTAAAEQTCIHGSGQAAVDGCTALIQSSFITNDNLAVAYARRGDAYFTLHRHALAIADYDEAIKHHPNDENTLFNRGAAHGILHHYQASIADYTAVIQYNAANADAYAARATGYSALKQYQPAMADLDVAITLKPKAAGSYNERSWIRAIANRQLDLALADCREADRLRPHDGPTLHTCALVQFRLGHTDEALKQCAAAVAASPNSAHALFLQGLLRQRIGDVGGKADIAAAKQIDPAIADAYEEMGIAL